MKVYLKFNVKKSFVLIEVIFAIIIISVLFIIIVPIYKNLKNKAIITHMSYIISKSIPNAVIAASLKAKDGNLSFRLKDILVINNLEYTKDFKWHYTKYYRYGTYSLRDESYPIPKVILRVTLDLDESNKSIIEYRINCLRINISTHKKLRKLCIKHFGDKDIKERIQF